MSPFAFIHVRSDNGHDNNVAHSHRIPHLLIQSFKYRFPYQAMPSPNPQVRINTPPSIQSTSRRKVQTRDERVPHPPSLRPTLRLRKMCYVRLTYCPTCHRIAPLHRCTFSSPPPTPPDCLIAPDLLPQKDIRHCSACDPDSQQPKDWDRQKLFGETATSKIGKESEHKNKKGKGKEKDVGVGMDMGNHVILEADVTKEDMKDFVRYLETCVEEAEDEKVAIEDEFGKGEGREVGVRIEELGKLSERVMALIRGLEAVPEV